MAGGGTKPPLFKDASEQKAFWKKFKEDQAKKTALQKDKDWAKPLYEKLKKDLAKPPQHPNCKTANQILDEAAKGIAKKIANDIDEMVLKELMGAPYPEADGMKGYLTTGFGTTKKGVEVLMVDSLSQLDHISKEAAKVIGIDYGKEESSSAIGTMKVLKSHNLKPGEAYLINTDFLKPGAFSFDNWTEPAKIDSNPKKGHELKPITIYRFGATTDGKASMKDVLGGKGANLCEMSSLGMPVPPGFIIPADVCVAYLNGGDKAAVMKEVADKVVIGMKYLKEQLGYMPLVSVRSGARVSMPGMMDTILNVGIHDSNMMEWVNRIGEQAALDSYRRFLQMYGTVALDIEAHEFEDVLADIKKTAKVTKDSELEPGYLNRLIKRYKDVYEANFKALPNPADALFVAVRSVFESWDNQRAKDYRKANNIPDDWGTAVTIQAMVFGNMNEKSCSGVAFSRDKSTGVRLLTGDYAVNAQGEDVVAGTHATLPVSQFSEFNQGLWIELAEMIDKLEKHFKDMQDVEFTVQDGKLWMLQARTGKRSAQAAFRIAYDMVNEGLIVKDEARTRVTKEQLLAVMRPSIDPSFKKPPIAKGIPAGGTVVTGKACFSAESAIACKAAGGNPLLIRKETNPDDFSGMLASVGVLTATGGTTSHAAVVANGFDKTCVVGCSTLGFKSNMAYFIVDDEQSKGWVKPGDLVSIDGATGNVYMGEVPVIEPQITEAVMTVAGWFSDHDGAYRITCKDIYELELAVQQSDASILYVDTCALELDSDLSLFENAIEHCKASTVIMDLCDAEDTYVAADKALNKMFGWNPTLGSGNKKATKLMKYGPAAAMKTVLKLPASCSLGDQLRKKGFKVIGPVKTVADLLNAEGAVTIDDETISKVFGTKEALMFVQEALFKAGKAPSKPMPEPVYWYEALLRKGA